MAEHDGGYKLLFSHPRTIEELLRGFVHEGWVERLDFSTLERVSASFVSRDLRQRHSDSIWRLRSGDRANRWFYVYLLLEFQSTPDPFMPVRLLSYVALLLEELIRIERPAPGDDLPVVLPLVLYNGKRRWLAPLDLAQCFRQAPRGLRRYLPRLRYLLVDEGDLQPADLERADNLVAALFRLETCEPEDFPREVQRLAALLPPGVEAELRAAFKTWLLRLARRTFRGATIPDTIELEDTAMLEETLLEWGEKLQTETKGRLDGMRRLLVQLMEQRFGPLPRAVRQRLRAIDSQRELERLASRVLTAQKLQDLGLP